MLRQTPPTKEPMACCGKICQEVLADFAVLLILLWLLARSFVRFCNFAVCFFQFVVFSLRCLWVVCSQIVIFLPPLFSLEWMEDGINCKRRKCCSCCTGFYLWRSLKQKKPLKSPSTPVLAKHVPQIRRTASSSLFFEHCSQLQRTWIFLVAAPKITKKQNPNCSIFLGVTINEIRGAPMKSELGSDWRTSLGFFIDPNCLLVGTSGSGALREEVRFVSFSHESSKLFADPASR